MASSKAYRHSHTTTKKSTYNSQELTKGFKEIFWRAGRVRVWVGWERMCGWDACEDGMWVCVCGWQCVSRDVVGVRSGECEGWSGKVCLWHHGVTIYLWRKRVPAWHQKIWSRPKAGPSEGWGLKERRISIFEKRGADSERICLGYCLCQDQQRVVLNYRKKVSDR